MLYPARGCTAALILLCAGQAAAADWFVATTGSDTTGNGSSGAPYATVNKAVASAAAGDSIYVAAGTYAFTTSPRITVNKAVSLFGAQAGADARSRSGPETIIEGGSGTVTAVSITTGGVTLDGFKVQGTGTNQSLILGAQPSSGPVAFQNFIIRNCWVVGVQGATGNGIHLQGSDALVERNLIVNCKNGLNGGTDRSTASHADDIRIKATIQENEFVGCRWTVGCYTNGALITKNLLRDSGDSAGTSNNGFQGEYFNTIVSDNVIRNYTNSAGNAIAIYVHNSRSANRPNQTNVVYRNNAITGCSIGVAVSPNQALAAQNVTFQNNSLSGNASGASNGQSDPEANPLDMRSCWWGDASGPSGWATGSGDAITSGILFDPWVGKDSSSTAAELTDDTPQALTVSSGSLSAGVDLAPNAGQGAGRSLVVTVQSQPPSQGFAGFFNELALAGSLSITTDLPDGAYVATIKMNYSDEQLLQAGIICEAGLVLMVWDASSSQWIRAVDKNVSPARANRGASAPTGNLGDYGVDTASNVVWAVVDHASEYAAGAVDASAVPVAVSAFAID